MLSPVRLSVCPSVCHTGGSVKNVERIIEILSPFDRPIILVFRHQGFLRKSDDFTPNRGDEYKGGSDFQPICGYISETVEDRGIFYIYYGRRIQSRMCSIDSGNIRSGLFLFYRASPPKEAPQCQNDPDVSMLATCLI